MTESRAPADDKGPAAKGRVGSDEISTLDLASEAGCRRLVCAGFCTFYRGEAKEEMACAGLAEVSAVLSGAADARSVLAELLASGEPVSYAHDAELAERICRRCDFLADGGCDHRNPELAPEERLEPCGGYVLLAALLGRA